MNRMLPRTGCITIYRSLYAYVEPSEIQETADCDLEVLFISLQHAVDSVGAKPICQDTLEALLSSFSNDVRRLFRLRKDWNLITVITAEKGENTLTRHSVEEYVSN